jgi:Leucine-rich repeat (LRR) protein
MENGTLSSSAQKCKLRWYQFSLRTLFILTALVAVVCSWFAVKLQEAKKQRETVQAIEKLGGSVHYNFFDDGTGNIIQPAPVGPAWLRNLLGHDFFDNVRIVNLNDSKDADAALRLLKDLPQVRNLVVAGLHVSDAGLADIDSLPQLTSLGVGNCGVGDDGVAHLKGLKQLKWLCLDNMGLSDQGLKHLEGLDQLEYLNLGMTHTTDAGLKHLKGLSHLRNLVLNNTEITDAGLECLRQLKQLEDLFLAQTQITDAGLEHLAKMQQLRCLGLPRQITDAAMNDLQRALPKCKISR